MADVDRGEAFGWDVERIEHPDEDGNFVLLPEGEYPFTVKKFERGRYDGGNKMCACPKAIITCEVDGGELGTCDIKNNLFLNKKCEGIIAQFFVALSLRKHGDPLVMRWGDIIGCRGMCKISHREYDGKTYGEIKRFLNPPANGVPEPAPAPAAQDNDEELPF